ncbi:PREDICTED: protein FAR1-RELATED SEQUENCE 5-like [Ipomoea nil]|uniref:protein FAR1-RELATED SEQUENCE 5-like n=1 Tax=Ipomoea nil TaxID=35883 RepID=UPI000901AEC1|nr:PREDICTED: protein FAR1-RELATED SEQUENCE 5-like [Ipomoea nil]
MSDTGSPELSGAHASEGDSDYVSHGVRELLAEQTTYWFLAVDSEITPVVGRRFSTLDEGIDFYTNYARVCGFDVRLYTMKRARDRETVMRYLVCNREGIKGGGISKPICAHGDSGGKRKQRRRRISNRVKCRARICFRKVSSGEFEITVFVEGHSHHMCSDASKLFMRVNRKLDVAHQAFAANCVRANAGSSKGFKLYREITGLYANVGATDTEFHNFKRDLQVYVDGKDGEMIIEKFKTKCAICENFFFDYDMDKENRVARLFWADPIGRRNFSLFGDTVSFDATYGTNRYNLVFVPFTEVDHHKRCITFAAGLLTKEDVESYTWLLQRFRTAMSSVSSCVITDQDPAMKIAIAQVLPNCRHRFCMWHIITKVNEKIGSDLVKDVQFCNKLNGIVWNETISVGEFEVQWHLLMEKYNLTTHRWFTKLYTEREFWIPAYFTDLPMSGLLRTTSRSEAENNVYGNCSRPHFSLVEFYMQYESVLETQRYKQSKLNAESEGYLPDFKTPLALERYLAQMFTIKIFYELQQEIEAGCFYCRVVGIREEGEVITYDIRGEGTATYTVQYTPVGNHASCSCKLFERLGLVCRHMFLVFRDAQIKSLPLDYVLPRWCKQVGGVVCCRQCSDVPSTESGPNRIWNAMHTCAALVGNNTDRKSRLVQVLEDLKREFMSAGPNVAPAKGNNAAIVALCGVAPPASITIKPPAQAKNKGTGKRIKSQRELAVLSSAKIGRKCGVCGEYARHNARSCPYK